MSVAKASPAVVVKSTKQIRSQANTGTSVQYPETAPSAPHPPPRKPKRSSDAPSRRDRLIFNASDLIQSYISADVAPASVPPDAVVAMPKVEAHREPSTTATYDTIKLPSTIPLIDYAAVPMQKLTSVKRGKQLICSVLHVSEKIEHSSNHSDVNR